VIVIGSYSMLKSFKFFLLISSLYFVGCSSIVHKKNVQLPNDKSYAIGSFWNYTETPMAGLRAASVVESVVAKEGIQILSLIEGNEKNALSQSKTEFLSAQKSTAKAKGASYLITGEVQEWRYKTGIDGEPVVSYSVKVFDLKSNRTLFNAIGAKSGWGNKSIGVVAQEIAKELIPQFIN